MDDQFKNWDRFHRHFTLTKDPRKALRWTRYEIWAEERRLKLMEQEAELLATASGAPTAVSTSDISR